MLRMKPIADAGKAESYYAKSDGGYYLDSGDLRRVWGGKGADLLGLSGSPDFEQFKRLVHGLDPHSGLQLTAKLIDTRVPGWDVTASVPKGVTTALERGDHRIHAILWEAARETMAELEQLATTRVRKGGRQEDRVTRNLVWYAVEHAETRPTKEDNMPDWDRHIHFVVFNATFDPAEKEWKAVKFRPIMDQRKYFDRRFDMRLAGNLAGLGYEIETSFKADGRGGRKYHSWDIKGVPGTVVTKFSRRTGEVDATEKKIVAGMKKADANAPDQLSAVARDKLGATSRRQKRDDLTLADYRAYWNSRITPAEGRQIAETIERAMLGQNPEPQPLAGPAMDYAIRHHFERNSVVDYHELAATAMERALGGALPEDIDREAGRKGVLRQDGQATTRAVWDQEERILAFARSGKGAFRPLAAGKTDGLDGLSREQKAAVRHVWDSTDQLVLIRGGAGTGKTTMMTPALARLGAPVVLLAPSADASRGQLRAEGFSQANTVAAFLASDDMQRQVKAGIIWVDEAGLLPVGDLDRLCGVAKQFDARIVLQGDHRQHTSVQRNGNMLRVLEDFASLPVAELKEIKRQTGKYAEAVAAIRDRDMEKGDAILRKLDWVVEGQGHGRLVEEYARTIEETKPDGKKKTVLVIDPTHADGDQLSEALREVRKDKGLISRDEEILPRLVALGWTEAEKTDVRHYSGDEVVQFFRRSGRFKAGDRVKASELLAHLPAVKPEHFAVYEEQTVNLARGDTIRITANGWDVTGKHRIDNGRIDEIAGFSPSGDPVLANGWVISKDFGHIRHGLVSTSHAAQSKTYDIVLASLNRPSRGAMGAEQGYVTASRGRERGMIFTDMPRAELLDAIRRQDVRQSATELMRRPRAQASPNPGNKWRAFVTRVQNTYRQLRKKTAEAIQRPIPLKERFRGR
jgi:conjugative relaxase-like TrwC/TraI family protein